MTGRRMSDSESPSLNDELIAAESAAQKARSNGFLGLANALDGVAVELRQKIDDVTRSSRVHAIETLTEHRLSGIGIFRPTIH